MLPLKNKVAEVLIIEHLLEKLKIANGQVIKKYLKSTEKANIIAEENLKNIREKVGLI